MSRSPQTRAKARPPEAEAPESPAIVLAPLRDHPFVAAAIALAGAMAAVAKFPNTPVPDSLITRVDAAQQALVQAANDLDQGFFTPALSEVIGAPVDTQGISERFDSMADALKVKFDEIEQVNAQRFAAIEARLPAAAPAETQQD